MTAQSEPTSTSAEQLAERLFTDAVTTMEMLSSHLGIQLGLYRALADGPSDARALAERTGIHPRYAREWLEHQAVAGILETDPADVDPYARTFTLPSGHQEALLDVDSPAYMGTIPGFVASFAGLLPQLENAYRSGDGIPYDAYGTLTRHGIAGMNRPMFRGEIADWIAAMPDVRERLSAGPARVLDVGCGTGASSFALATHFPAVRVHGVDLDAASVAEAEVGAKREGLSDRVTFERGDAAALATDERYDLVCIFEALHDMADPVASLRAARAALAPGGAVLIADEKVAEQFAPPGDLVERLNYGFSVLHCLPATRAEGSAVEAGTVIRPQTVRDYAERAGFGSTVLPIENDLWRFYRLDAA